MFKYSENKVRIINKKIKNDKCVFICPSHPGHVCHTNKNQILNDWISEKKGLIRVQTWSEDGFSLFKCVWLQSAGQELGFERTAGPTSSVQNHKSHHSTLIIILKTVQVSLSSPLYTDLPLQAATSSLPTYLLVHIFLVQQQQTYRQHPLFLLPAATSLLTHKQHEDTKD